MRPKQQGDGRPETLWREPTRMPQTRSTKRLLTVLRTCFQTHNNRNKTGTNEVKAEQKLISDRNKPEQKKFCDE